MRRRVVSPHEPGGFAVWRGPVGGGSVHGLLRHPRSFEVDCPVCRRRALFHVRDGRLSFSTDEQAAEIRASARARTRAAYDEDT